MLATDMQEVNMTPTLLLEEARALRIEIGNYIFRRGYASIRVTFISSLLPGFKRDETLALFFGDRQRS